jgi:hypothetical protein
LLFLQRPQFEARPEEQQQFFRGDFLAVVDDVLVQLFAPALRDAPRRNLAALAVEFHVVGLVGVHRLI